MRQLDTCDFCGDAAEGVYEVVPASVAGEPRRLALCAACRETLRSVVDPLLDAARDADAGEASDAPGAVADSPDDGVSDGADAGSTGTATSDGADSEGVTIEVGGGEDDGGAEAGHGDENDDGAEAADGDAAGGAPAGRPSGYAQLIRLLQNRDGAMPREDLRALATNAYDLTSRQFEAALDAAVQNGDVEETADGLRTV